MQHPNVYRPFKYGGVAIQNTVTTYTVAGPATRVLRIQPSIDCWVILAAATAAPVAGTANSMPLTALQGAQSFLVAPGEVLSIINNDGVSSGWMAVTEMTR